MKVPYESLLIRFKKMVGQFSRIPSRDYILASFAKKGIKLNVKQLENLLSDYKAWKKPSKKAKKAAPAPKRVAKRRSPTSPTVTASGGNETDATVAIDMPSSQPESTPSTPPARTETPTQAQSQLRSYGAAPKTTRSWGR